MVESELKLRKSGFRAPAVFHRAQTQAAIMGRTAMGDRIGRIWYLTTRERARAAMTLNFLVCLVKVSDVVK